MSEYRCIVIGINDYQTLPPLQYSQGDAQSLYRFFEQTGGFSPIHSHLLHEQVENKKIPRKDNILEVLHPLDPSAKIDQFLLFFKGYGLSYAGEDYILPLDANTEDIVNTGITVRSLFSTLLDLKADSLIVCLDIIQLPSFSPMGNVSKTLAKQMGIGLIFCQQTQEITETSENLTQGLLTLSLLEALWYYRHHLTLAHLDEYLRDRYWQYKLKTQQNLTIPTIISPNHTLTWKNLLPLPSPKPLLSEPASVAIREETEEINEDPETLTPSTPVYFLLRPSTLVKILIAGGGLTLLASLLFLRWLPSRQPAVEITPSPSPPPQLPPLPPAFREAQAQLRYNQASDFNRAIGNLRSIKEGEVFYEQAETDVQRWSQVIFDIAQGRATLEDFRDAIAAAQLIPADQIPLYGIAQEKTREWQQKLQQQQKNKIIMEAARQLIRPRQASSYNQAIALLRQIPPQEPGYRQAQQLMEKWSQSIYNLAQERASQKKWALAIQTAELVPPNTSVTEKAQQAIALWQLASRQKSYP